MARIVVVVLANAERRPDELGQMPAALALADDVPGPLP